MDPATQHLVITAMLAAPIAWAGTQGFKAFLLWRWPVPVGSKDSPWWQWSLRFVSMGIGACVGAYSGGGWSNANEVLAGTCGGALCAFIVAQMKVEAGKAAQKVIAAGGAASGAPESAPEGESP